MGVTTNYTITSAAGLQTDIRAIDKTGAEAASDTNYTFTFDLAASGNVLALSQQLDAINLDAGSTLTINGNGAEINGGGVYNGLFVYAGTVSISDLEIDNAKAVGGAGGSGSHGGGGGAGLGGGLFVANGADVTLQGVVFEDDAALGGAGGGVGPAKSHNGGGGGLEGGPGGSGTGGDPQPGDGLPGGYGGGGGGVGLSAYGGSADQGGGPGIIPGAASGSSGTGTSGIGGGKSAGGGGSNLSGGSGGVYGGGGGVYGLNARPFAMGTVLSDPPLSGDFGGGGGGSGGRGGFGGGGGGGKYSEVLGAGRGHTGTRVTVSGTAGFGAGNGGTLTGGGGGGLGAGGDVFVQQGGTLVIEGGFLAAGTVAGGAAAGSGGKAGDGFGSGLFIQGNEAVTLAALPGQTLYVEGVIADQDGSIANSGGAGTIILGGGGGVALLATNTYTGSTTVTAGTTLFYDADGALGGGGLSLLDASELLVTTAAFSFGTGVFDGPEDFTALPYGDSGIIPGGPPQYFVEDPSGGTELIPQTMTVNDLTGLIAAVREFSDASQSRHIEAILGAPTPPSFTIDLGAGITLDPSYGDNIFNVDLGADTSLTLAGDGLAGSGTVVLGGGGTFVPSVANTFVAPIIDMGDTLILAADDDLGPDGNALTLQALSTLAFSTGFVLDHPLELAAGLESVAVPLGQSATLASVINGTGTLVVTGPGNLDLSNGGAFSGGIRLDGGTLTLSTPFSAGSGPIVFGAAADPVLAFGPLDAPGNLIEQFYAGDTIVIDGFVASSTIEAPGTGGTPPELTLRNNSAVVELRLPGVVFPDVLIRTVGSDTVITTDQVMCFAAGTRIATPAGARPVETLRPGQAVLALEPDASRQARPPSVRTVRWVGRRVLDLATHPEPELAAPVRLRAGALGAGLPRRDLIVSPDHCLFFDGHLLRAFRLINGVSVVQGRPASIEYWHVELADHALLLAESVAAESYLDEGTRGFFAGDGIVPGPRHPRETAACAPYAPDDAFAERLWRQVARRAGAVPPPPAAAPEPCVFAGERPLRPILTQADRRLYALPPGVRSLRLVSAAARPTAAQPWRADRRRLGAGLRRVCVDTETRLAVDGAAFGPGWHAAEGAALRWSTGDAVLHVPRGTRIVELQLAG